jgi:hypothetical protein
LSASRSQALDIDTSLAHQGNLSVLLRWSTRLLLAEVPGEQIVEGLFRMPDRQTVLPAEIIDDNSCCVLSRAQLNDTRLSTARAATGLQAVVGVNN